MQFQSPLIPARLLRRYKRFLADVVLEDGREVTVHCPNPGAMTGLADEGARCWLEPAGAGRKLPFGWRLVELEAGHLANIDTSLPNRIVAEGLRAGQVPALAAYTQVRPEVRMGASSRVDFHLSGPGLPDAWVEVKSVTLRRGMLGAFPDCVTTRGARHLQDLADIAAGGQRAVMLFLLGRTDCTGVTIAGDIDPAYGRAFQAARVAEVEMLAHGCHISPAGIHLGAAVPVIEG